MTLALQMQYRLIELMAQKPRFSPVPRKAELQCFFFTEKYPIHLLRFFLYGTRNQSRKLQALMRVTGMCLRVGLNPSSLYELDMYLSYSN